MGFSLSTQKRTGVIVEAKILLNLAEKRGGVFMGGNQRDTLRSDNVIMAIRRRIVLVCKAAAAHNRQHSGPTSVMSRVNRAFKMSF